MQEFELKEKYKELLEELEHVKQKEQNLHQVKENKLMDFIKREETLKRIIKFKTELIRYLYYI